MLINKLLLAGSARSATYSQSKLIYGSWLLLLNNNNRCYSMTTKVNDKSTNTTNDETKQSSKATAGSSSNNKINNAAVKLFASVCVERMPVITCEMNELEKRYSNLINEINVKKSLLSNHELRHRKDLEDAAKRKKEKNSEKQEITIETAVDLEEKCLKELNAFNFGARDLSSEHELIASDVAAEGGFSAEKKEMSTSSFSKSKRVLQNADRILDKKLILIVHDPIRSAWELPKIEWTSDEASLRLTAERALRNLNDKLTVKFMGNAPVGVIKRKINDTSIEKNYFFKCQYTSGAEHLATSKYDFVWIRKEELGSFIKDKNYLNCLEDFILDF